LNRILFPAVLLLLTAAGCVRYDETIALDAAGKGTATLVFQRPKHSALTSQLGTNIELFSEAVMSKDLPASVHLSWSRTEDNDMYTTTATYTFDDIKALIAWAAANRRSPLNNISLLEKPGELDFSRRIAPVDEQTVNEIKEFGADISITFTLKGPGRLIETNATKAEGSTARWEFKAAELFGPSGRTLTARFESGAGTRAYALPALAILAAAAMIAFLKLRRGRGRR
jgi:hypothetical protein